VKSNPFDLIVPTPNEGLGLNPILQDPLLVVHPPFLYLGYVGFSLTLSLVLAAIITKQLDSTWAKISWPWVVLSWVFLTIGISLGSIWAYYELGWGGYWFWDPVENASLMPWLASTALIHSLLVLKIKNKMQNWTALLAIMTFSLSLLGTFLVRSGILTSVHAFANDPDRGIFILVIIFFITTASLLIYIFCSSNTSNNKISFFSKENFLNINNLFLLFFLFIILLGTIYPIIFSAFGETISIGPDYYNTILAPFIFIFLIAMTIGPILKWSRNIGLKDIYFLCVIFFTALIISFLIIFFTKRNELILYLGLASSLVLILTILFEIYKIRYKINTINFSRLCSHLGVGVFILSVFLNSYFSKTKDFEIQTGEIKQFDNLSLNLANTNIYKINNYLEMKTDFEIVDGDKIFTLKPSIRRYFQPNQITSETSIKPTLLSNHYLVINFPDLNSKVIGARYYYNFFIHGIWFGLLLIIFGGILSVFKKRI
jgi:cytochrome c-type biogenesis protein CcmF